jgi:hypothetical protein
MHNLETSIADWRKTMIAVHQYTPGTLDELESHLRETVQELVRTGLDEAQAFHRAVAGLGSPLTLASEFEKLRPALWLPVKIVTAVIVALALALVCYLPFKMQSGAWSLLLAVHVFTVTLGYATTLLLGLLGICFVCQRCRSDFSAGSQESLARISAIFARVGACFTLIGIVLGSMWSKLEWGRYWDWDAKEIGGLCIMIWLVCYVIAQRSRGVAPRALLLACVFGGNVVALGWFGPNLLSGGLHSYGTPDYSWLLLAGTVLSLSFILLGMAPAGWLRSRRA